jgi:shikimate dehydrogenase
VVNRSTKRGQELVALLNERAFTAARFVPWDHPYTIPPDTDVVVNATSIGLYPDVAAKPEITYDAITAQMVVCDVIPNPPRTPFLEEAERRGARTLDGLGMLVYQGAIGFAMWTGLEAPVEVMREALAQAFR